MTVRYELLNSMTTGETCLIRVEDEMVVAVVWGIDSVRRAQWISDMESGDAADYVDTTAGNLDESVDYEFFVSRNNARIHATMTV